jgi:hypothetical protein
MKNIIGFGLIGTPFVVMGFSISFWVGIALLMTIGGIITLNIE